MKKYHRLKCRQFILLLGLLVGSAAANAQQAENESVPRRLFEAQGIMGYLDLPAGTVSIDKKLYRLSPGMKWYGLPDPQASLMRQSLRLVDRPVGYIVDAEKKAPTVKAIWILPTGGR